MVRWFDSVEMAKFQLMILFLTHKSPCQESNNIKNIHLRITNDVCPHDAAKWIFFTCWQAAGMCGRRTGTSKRGGGRTSTGGFALGTTSAGKKHLKSHEFNGCRVSAVTASIKYVDFGDSSKRQCQKFPMFETGVEFHYLTHRTKGFQTVRWWATKMKTKPHNAMGSSWLVKVFGIIPRKTSNSSLPGQYWRVHGSARNYSQ